VIPESKSHFNRRLSALLAAVGLLSSVALELAHYQAYVDPARAGFCSAGAQLDCTTVALSSWSVFLGVPLPMWGVAGFLTIAVLAWWRSKWLLPVSGFAALVSLLLLGIEVASIHSICILCEVVHVLAIACFALAWRGRSDLGATDRLALAQLATVVVSIPITAHFMMAPYWAIYSWRSGVHLPNGVDEQGRHWIGAENPSVVLHEYVDYGCPHCAVVAHRTQQVLARYPRSLRIVRHLYPRTQCPKTPDMMACSFARTAICAGEQGAFWLADSWLFEHAAGRLVVDLQKAANDLHLDYGKLVSCVESDAAFARAQAEMDDANKHQVHEAPSYVIDGKLYSVKDAFVELGKRL
jgi:uncharacterized membrane protein